MIRTPSEFIDALGGTRSVADMTKNKVTTVHSWRLNGIPEGRLDHLVLAAERANKSVPEHDAASIIRPGAAPSSGKCDRPTAAVAADCGAGSIA